MTWHLTSSSKVFLLTLDISHWDSLPFCPLPVVGSGIGQTLASWLWLATLCCSHSSFSAGVHCLGLLSFHPVCHSRPFPEIRLCTIFALQARLPSVKPSSKNLHFPQSTILWAACSITFNLGWLWRTAAESLTHDSSHLNNIIVYLQEQWFCCNSSSATQLYKLMSNKITETIPQEFSKVFVGNNDRCSRYIQQLQEKQKHRKQKKATVLDHCTQQWNWTSNLLFVWSWI